MRPGSAGGTYVATDALGLAAQTTAVAEIRTVRTTTAESEGLRMGRSPQKARAEACLQAALLHFLFHLVLSESVVANEIEAEPDVTRLEARGRVAAHHLVHGGGSRVAEDDLEDVPAHLLGEGGVPRRAAGVEVVIARDRFKLYQVVIRQGEGEAHGDVEGV